MKTQTGVKNLSDTKWESTIVGIASDLALKTGADIIKNYFLQQQELQNSEAMVNEICTRVQKIVDLAFFREYKAQLRALQKNLDDYAANPHNTSTLDECHVMSQELFQKFTDFHTLEGIAAAMYAATLHLITLRSESDHDPGGLVNLQRRAKEMAEWVVSSSAEVLSIYEKSITPISINSKLVAEYDSHRDRFVRLEKSISYYDFFMKEWYFPKAEKKLVEEEDRYLSQDDLKKKYEPTLIKECKHQYEVIFLARRAEGIEIQNVMLTTADKWKNINLISV